jgi:hypothetical protein
MQSETKPRCPHDGGTCHHKCGTNECFREDGDMFLTKPWEGYPLPGHERLYMNKTADLYQQAAKHERVIAHALENMDLAPALRSALEFARGNIDNIAAVTEAREERDTAVSRLTNCVKEAVTEACMTEGVDIANMENFVKVANMDGFDNLIQSRWVRVIWRLLNK